ncbi:MAG: WD40/YVTN/BNR-like repeat-containing protein [Planctomycetota bacterium]|jgi:photosystem II stability/assembly factor-like uncharacterized protein
MSRDLWVGTRKGLFHIQRDDGGAWSISDTIFLGDPVSLVLVEPGGRRIHAALDLGHFGIKMQRSEDGGVTWEESAVPAYPEKPDGLVDLDPGRGLEIPWTTKLIWALAQGPGREMWCGTLPGGLFHSQDGGDSWEIMRNLWDDERRGKMFGGGYDLPAIHSILVDPRDSDHVTIAISVGGVWKTRDGGATWDVVGEGLRAAYMPEENAGDAITQDPHCVVACPAAPDRLWMQHHNGIFRSDDGGDHWQEITDVAPSAFGFAVAVHPTDPDTAWIVPATEDQQRYPVDGRVVVTRTRDGGKTFDKLTNGLPEPPAYDLTYRHALDVDGSGNQLAFGSTTGSLWVSGDQGDSWEAVSEHLPPVLCVRFAPE